MHALDQAIADATLLLSYATRKGIDVPDEVATSIVGVVTTDDRTSDNVAQLWKALSAIARLVQPVTVESLKASLAEPTGAPGQEHRRPISRADAAVRRYRRWAYRTLVCLAIIQIYTIVGVNALSDVDSPASGLAEVARKFSELSAEVQAKTETPTPSVPPVALVRDMFELSALRFKLETEWLRLETSDLVLQRWSLGWHPVRAMQTILPGIQVANATADAPAASSLADSEQQAERYAQRPYTREHYEAVLESRVALAALQNYILPFLYGLLGACVFILRTLAGEVRSVTFSSDVGFRLRLPLGALAGVAIAWFPNMMNASEAFKGVTPLALAFMAGYSVEVLFTAMDRLITALSGE